MTQTFNSWPLSKKMLAVFGFIALLISALGATAVVSNQTLSGVATRHVTRGIAGTESLGRVLDELREHRIILWTLVSAQSADEIRTLEGRYADSRAKLADAMADYAPLAGEFQGTFDQLNADIEALERVNDTILRARVNGGNTLALVRGPGREASDKALREGQELIALSNKRSEDANHAGEATARTTMIFTIALLLFAMGALFVVWRLIVASVAVPLSKVASTTTVLAEGGTADVPYRDRKDELGAIANAVEAFRVAAVTRADADARAAAEQAVVTTALRDSLALLREGDLTSTISADFPPAYGELKTNFNEALEALRELIGSVLESTVSIRTGSTEIAQASEDLARRTESNAASLEETSAAVTQMDDRLKATAEAAKSTVERADGAIATVSGGRGIADEAVQAMGRVSESAKGIDSVIEGLDKIAFQTRVLAMNAAVEAGRAGEAGRGFAVVADLVSALAMRAEEEAGRARDQLTATQTDIVAAVDMVQKVDGALAHIVDDVSEVHKLLGDMARDNEAQSSAITQISTAIASMDQSTQQNAAMVEQTSAAARNLNSEIGGLADQAARFRVDSGAQSRQSVARAAAAAPAKAKGKNGSIYVSPVKPLPAAAVAKLTAPGDDDWASF